MILDIEIDVYNRAREAYIELTNRQESYDPDTGFMYFCADDEIMNALDELFEL